MDTVEILANIPGLPFLSESGHIVNVIDSSVELDKVSYKYIRDVGLVVTDDRDFLLNINEFGARS